MTGASNPNVREPRRSRKRAPQIIEAAAKVFAERGFHAATTQDIADILNIRQASLYYYFQSKENALELVCLKSVEGVFEKAKAIAKARGTATERLTNLIVSHLVPIRDRVDFVKVFLDERQYLPDESRRRIGKLSRNLERIFEDVLKEGVQQNEFRADLDVRVVTLAILGMENSVTGWYKKAGIPMDRVAHEFVRLLLWGTQSTGRRPRFCKSSAEG